MRTATGSDLPHKHAVASWPTRELSPGSHLDASLPGRGALALGLWDRFRVARTVWTGAKVRSSVDRFLARGDLVIWTYSACVLTLAQEHGGDGRRRRGRARPTFCASGLLLVLIRAQQLLNDEHREPGPSLRPRGREGTGSEGGYRVHRIRAASAIASEIQERMRAGAGEQPAGGDVPSEKTRRTSVAEDAIALFFCAGRGLSS